MAGRRKLTGARCWRQARSERDTHPNPNRSPNPNPNPNPNPSPNANANLYKVLYYPERWWHRTGNAASGAMGTPVPGAKGTPVPGAKGTPTMGTPILSLSRSIVTPGNARAVAAALHAFCRRS